MHRSRENHGKRRRQCKVEEQVKRILGDILQGGVNDPRIGFVSVVRVETTGDLKNARVYVSIMGEDAEVEKSLEGLRSARSYFQRELGHQMSSRYTPVISFVLDESIEYSERIDRILSELHVDREDDFEDSPPTD